MLKNGLGKFLDGRVTTMKFDPERYTGLQQVHKEFIITRHAHIAKRA